MLIKKERTRRLFERIKEWNFRAIHLLFADDSIFFTRGDKRSVSTLKSVLQIYSEGSGQRVNLQKSSIFFGNRCLDDLKERVMNELNIYNAALQSTYLGMPICIKR